jgi:hypothetical protein
VPGGASQGYIEDLNFSVAEFGVRVPIRLRSTGKRVVITYEVQFGVALWART